ncbi:MAG TPA: hypothetical protein PK177_01820 [Burkholderiaceae bacterium]|nr:hypothetical protein [Burkholderiaceae bacterium]
MKKSLAVLAAAAGFAFAAPASAIVVGGIDFGTMGESPTNRHLETATLAQTFINGNGQNATAYGFITTVNGNASYCGTGGNCGLFYIASFNNSQNFSPDYVEFTSSTIDVYFTNDASLNLLDQDSQANLALIAAMTPWVTLSGHNNLGGGAAPNAVATGSGTLTGETLSGNAEGLLDVTGGQAAVVSFLDSDGVGDAAGGFADIAYTASFNNFVLNEFDVANGLAIGCADGSASPGAWCYQGTSNLRGDTEIAQVPAPAPLALLAIGLFGLGVVTRSRKS